MSIKLYNIEDDIFINNKIHIYDIRKLRNKLSNINIGMYVNNFPDAFISYSDREIKTNTLFFVSMITDELLENLKKITTYDGYVDYNVIRDNNNNENILFFVIFNSIKNAEDALIKIREDNIINEITFSNKNAKIKHINIINHKN